MLDTGLWIVIPSEVEGLDTSYKTYIQNRILYTVNCILYIEYCLFLWVIQSQLGEDNI
jgi:hypothetical protein